MWHIHSVFLKNSVGSTDFVIGALLILQMSNYSVSLSIVNKLDRHSARKYLLSNLNICSYS